MVGVWVSLPEGVTKAVTGAPLTEKASVTPEKPLGNQKKAQKTKSDSRKKRNRKSDYLAVPPESYDYLAA